MNHQRIRELRRLCAAAKWDAVSEPMVLHHEGAVVVWLPDATRASDSGPPVKTEGPTAWKYHPRSGGRT